MVALYNSRSALEQPKATRPASGERRNAFLQGSLDVLLSDGSDEERTETSEDYRESAYNHGVALTVSDAVRKDGHAKSLYLQMY